MVAPKGTNQYLNDQQIKQGLAALRQFIEKKDQQSSIERPKKDLLEAGDQKRFYIFVEVAFKNIPEVSRTFIHAIRLPHHWRWHLEPEEENIALFVPHRRPDTEAQAIQLARDRDLDMDNTHSFYKNLLKKKLDASIYSRISKIISIKELATDYNTYQKIDRLSKAYDLFLGDKKLMFNKFNPLPRRLGRRFWVREKKVPLMVKLSAKRLNERFVRALSTEPFYITGRSATERICLGMHDMPTNELVDNIKVFLTQLSDLYGDSVRFIKFRTTEGLSLPVFADLSLTCKKVVVRKKTNKRKTKIE